MHSLSYRTTGSNMSAKASALIIRTRINWICRAQFVILVSTWKIMISGLIMLMIKLNSIIQHQLKMRFKLELKFRVNIRANT